MGIERRRGLGLTYDIVIAFMGVVSFLFSYIGISMSNLIFHFGLKPDAINVVSVGIFILISWYGLGIIINHRAIGPMGAVKRHFSIVANGDYYLKFKLRKGDDMRHVCEHLNDMTAKLIAGEIKSTDRLRNIRVNLETILRDSKTGKTMLSKEVQSFVEKCT